MAEKPASTEPARTEILARAWAALLDGRPDEAERMVKALTALLKAEAAPSTDAAAEPPPSAPDEDQCDDDRLELERRIRAAVARAHREAYRAGRRAAGDAREPG